jgi:hypothetical protein
MSAKTNGFATLMIVNSTSSSPTPYTPARSDDADPEELGRCLRERRVDLRRPTVVDRREALIRIVHEHADALGWRKLSGRDEGCRAFEGHPRVSGIA